MVARYCGTNHNLTIDHVIPKSKGGKWDWQNLVTACNVCNGKKGEKSLQQLKWKLRTQPRVRESPAPFSFLPQSKQGLRRNAAPHRHRIGM